MSSRLRQEIADLNPGYGTWVMATAIVSTGLGGFGFSVLSEAILVIACVAFALLLVAYGWRLIAHWQRTLDDLRNPGRAFGYFSLVAAPNVVAVRLAEAGDPTAAWVLGAASIPLWVLLTYAILGSTFVGHREGPVLPALNGSWFLLVVATQSLSVTASTVAAEHPDLKRALAALAVALWGIGVMLYLMLVGLVTVHVLEMRERAHALGPTYWIYMGAIAISVLAAAQILQLPTWIPVIAATRQLVSGLAFLLWAFGTWWVPLLLAIGIWREGIHREYVTYEAAWWSMVFPLGMYAAATEAFGRVNGLGFMVDIARGEVWLGFAAWLAVSVGMVVSFRPAHASAPPARVDVTGDPAGGDR